MGLPFGLSRTYDLVPTKNTTQAKNIKAAGIPSPIDQLTFDCIYTISVKDIICAKVSVKKYQLKKLLIPFFPASVFGLN